MRLLLLYNDDSYENYVLIETKGLSNEQIEKSFRVKVRRSFDVSEVGHTDGNIDLREWPTDQLLT